MMNAVATSIVLFVAAALIGAMFLMIRLMSDGSDKHSELKAFVETLFGSPAHLRTGSDGNEPPIEGKEANGQTKLTSAEPYTELCPACEETVTHEHEQCPSCGLRLL
ncbi:hypothetical protein FHS14_001179 [Paenibacillus baekrokdamisoli]|nr:hypothetical protein [Paenibacillus baekrokdamisoli]MBB3068203.1 hypothetical protein [Paenibacillus baekrokdamisoli]